MWSSIKGNDVSPAHEADARVGPTTVYLCGLCVFALLSGLKTRNAKRDTVFMLKIEAQPLRTIRYEARLSYPHECCGLLLGRFENDGRVAVQAWPTPNEWTPAVGLSEDEDAHSLGDRFYISPAAYFKAQRAAMRQNLDVVGCYHSHPDDRAWPSPRDLAGAAGVGGGPDFSFVVISVLGGEPDAIASALLSADGREWLHEDLVTEAT